LEEEPRIPYEKTTMRKTRVTFTTASETRNDRIKKGRREGISDSKKKRALYSFFFEKGGFDSDCPEREKKSTA